MARLGEILLSEKVLTARELDSALENHVLHGVKLGTCLVEMGVVSDDDLARCLGKKSGHAFLTKDQLLAFGTRNLSVISPAAIKKHRLIPVGVDGATLRIATDQDLSPKKLAEIERFLGRKIEPVAVSGYAIDIFLEQMFGIQRPGRFLPKYSGVKPQAKTPTIATKVREKAAPIVIDGIEWKSLGDVTQAEGSAWASDDFFNAAPDREDVPLSLSDAAGHLSRATSRDDVAKTVLDFMSNSSGTVALVIIKDGVARGWKACSNRKKFRDFEAFSSPMESLPELQQCVVTGKPNLGSPLSAETKLLLQKLHSAGERSAFFPIFLQQRVIAVLLCDVSERLNPAETAELCRKASYALEILVLRSKLLS
ncbi:MAG: hypothetical protein P4L44_14650 [Oryzomonas sp.]|uniref:GspE/PulE/PilB domain-containing protein n=1 Tax=Oryzomonas sp. TaxID=2855186 RepID=UPI002843DB4D|nr:hypothetical protein [Oryzomonas sp.]MDR3581198.1 hypothetical protein [Oryzomonas sp.]